MVNADYTQIPARAGVRATPAVSLRDLEDERAREEGDGGDDPVARLHVSKKIHFGLLASVLYT